MKQVLLYFIFILPTCSIKLHLMHDKCSNCVYKELTQSCEENCFDYIIEMIKYDSRSQYHEKLENEELEDFCIENDILMNNQDCCYLYGLGTSICAGDPYSICPIEKHKTWMNYIDKICHNDPLQKFYIDTENLTLIEGRPKAIFLLKLS